VTVVDSKGETKSVAVVGAGIGGLTAAAALHSLGWAVTVLERAPAIAEVGAGLTLWPNAVRALDVLGLANIVSAHAIPTVSRGNIRQPDGRWLRRRSRHTSPALSRDSTGSNRAGMWVVGICMISAAVVAWTLTARGRAARERDQAERIGRP